MVGLYQDPYDDWQNSGYGLYVSSSLCTLGGHFILASGNDATFLNNSWAKELFLNNKWHHCVSVHQCKPYR